ncbi:MAG: hypothetical protein JJU11_07620 [Candidatus Sumerlaeia bacterium]|nr:hypothetical protein [Candidatus Sumerlaeia bacterium]
MPCDDVTEILQVVLDDGNHLTGYALSKRSCGRAVGEKALLLEELGGRHEEEILALDPEVFADPAGNLDDAEFVLRFKHLLALQSGLRVIAGHEPGGEGNAVRVGQVTWDAGELILDAVISVDVITEKIESCGRCKGCAGLAKKVLAGTG